MVKLFNSLTKKVETFTPLTPDKVGIYTCGPTVYQYAHIGNFRAYMTADLLVRTLQAFDYEVNFIMNITDVGHLVSDDDTGEDKLQKSAKREGKTAWDIAEFYTEAFLTDYDSLHFIRPTVLAKATDHIEEQIALVKRLEEKGFTYVITDGVYFDTSKLADYGKLSTLDQIKEGARVEINHEKRNPRDFALWKFSPHESTKRDMEWESPWGTGFPGWHIECSAMSMKYLGETFDIHTGGVDHISVHHTNELAQSEAATGKPFVHTWIHTAFMLVNGQKMSKSLGNTYLLSQLKDNGFTPIHLRYLYLQTHYRQEMNFTWESLTAARNAVERLISTLSHHEPGTKSNKAFVKKFHEALGDDLNTPQALAVMWDMLKSSIPSNEKRGTMFEMDKILGLGLEDSVQPTKVSLDTLPQAIQSLVAERTKAREAQDFKRSDELRDEIRSHGYIIQDTPQGLEVKKMLS